MHTFLKNNFTYFKQPTWKKQHSHRLLWDDPLHIKNCEACYYYIFMLLQKLSSCFWPFSHSSWKHPLISLFTSQRMSIQLLRVNNRRKNRKKAKVWTKHFKVFPEMEQLATSCYRDTSCKILKVSMSFWKLLLFWSLY